MAKIRILPEQLANQIAAGEVVERPASVVKELIENSLDAGADHIAVEIEGGGTRLIRIIDNGEGMAEDDVLLCLERHGTSKISEAADLAAINTLGFRGEAIPSIGSVAQLTIISRPAAADLGTKAVLHYGKLTAVHEMGCGVGSIFEVRNLFGNTPARRKFLRSARTELNHIDEVIKNYALASPHVTFVLTIDDRQSLYLDSSLSLDRRLAQIIHHRGEVIPLVKGPGRGDRRQLTGYLVPPEQVSLGAARLRLFVNGRAIKDRMLGHAVTEGMRGFLMKGKNPAGLVHLTIPPDEVDVNVHPAKHEVRFRQAQDIHLFVVEAVAEAIAAKQRQLQGIIFGASARTAATPIPLNDAISDALVTDLPFTLAEDHPAMDFLAAAPSGIPSPPPVDPAPSRPAGMADQQPGPSPPPEAEGFPRLRATTAQAPPTDQATRPVPPPRNVVAAPAGRHNLQIIGQFANLYIFCSNENGLLVIDQHAAHERLLYEDLRRQFHAKGLARQNLLFPATVELSILQTQFVERYSDEIEAMGFSLREFGGNSYVIAAIPALAGQADPVALFLDVLAQFGTEGNQGDTGSILDSILAGMACKAAVKAGTSLDHREIDDLLNRMARADLFSHCPHGRPVVRHFPHSEIKKWFYRT